MSAVQIEVQMLGPMTLRCEGQEVRDTDNRARKIWLLLAYMAARGIPEETAYELMAKARIHRVCERIPDEATRQLVEQELEGGNDDE